MIPLLLFALATLPSVNNCSGTTLSGTVRDPSAALIPGATLTLDAVPAKPSGSDGRFTLPCLAPGSHTLIVSSPGFTPSTVTVKLPRNVPLDLTLAPETVQTTIDVDAVTDAPSVNRVGPSQTLAGKQLQQLADDPDDLLRQLQQLAAAAGGNPGNATITVDGFQDSTTLPPKSSIAYIKVNPDLFSAEFRDPPFGNGGRIEVYTKPGQKTFHGALFTTNGSPWENARDPFSTAKAALGKQRYGLEFGGPLRKQGSDFFTALEYRRIDNAAVIDAVTVSAGGTLQTISANVPTPQRLWLSSARAGWQLSPKNTFIASYTGSVSSLRNLGVGGVTLAEAAHDAQVYDNTLRLSNITTASAHLMHETRLSLRWFGEQDTPASTAPQFQIAGAFTGGGAPSGTLHYQRFRLEADDDFILTTAHHTLKAGTQFFFNNDHRYLPNNFNGNYTFGGGPAPVLDATNQPVPGQTATISGLEQYRRAQLHLPGGTPTAFSIVTGNPEIDFLQVNDALFLQDDWKLPHHLQISFGLRYFLQTQPLLTDAATPRLSLQWSPGKDAKWDFHAHAGLFAGILIPNDYAQVVSADGIQRISSTVYNPTFGAPFSAGATPILTQRQFAPHISAPLYSTYNLGGSRSYPSASSSQPISAPDGLGTSSAPTTSMHPLPARPPAPVRLRPTSTSFKFKTADRATSISNTSASRTTPSSASSSSPVPSTSRRLTTSTTTPSLHRKPSVQMRASSPDAAMRPPGKPSGTSLSNFLETSSSAVTFTAPATSRSTSRPASTTTATATSMTAPKSPQQAHPARSRRPTASSPQAGASLSSVAIEAYSRGRFTSTPTSSVPSNSLGTPRPNTHKPSPPTSAPPTSSTTPTLPALAAFSALLSSTGRMPPTRAAALKPASATPSDLCFEDRLDVRERM